LPSSASRPPKAAHFAEWLDARHVPWQLVAVDRGDAVPGRSRGLRRHRHDGRTDERQRRAAWIAPLNAFVRRAVEVGVPVIGHCLGGQLLAQSLGARVTRTSTPEIGWIDVDVQDASRGREWFGARNRFTPFQWHYDVFDLPQVRCRCCAMPSIPTRATSSTSATSASSATSR
jgi:hypothetical protein